MRLLVFRLSAMGDVALTVPALRAVLEANPGLHISFVTRNTFAPFFEDIPRFTLITPDLSQYKGFTGPVPFVSETAERSRCRCSG
ncbi:MAG: hypothetical protein J7K46_12410 [Bacteroidales bacterium]|nr:hypothetical protein [Bacteroidales bacterium]